MITQRFFQQEVAGIVIDTNIETATVAATTASERQTDAALETLASLLYDDLTVTEIVRPAAVLSGPHAQAVLDELGYRDARIGGNWAASPDCWRRYEQPWDGIDERAAANAGLIGSIQVAYGTPGRYDITIYRATVTLCGSRAGYTVQSLLDEMLGFAGLTLASCPRIDVPTGHLAMRAALVAARWSTY
jgi:hypothetical protein